MKYLKKYEASISSPKTDFLQECKDILIDITHDTVVMVNCLFRKKHSVGEVLEINIGNDVMSKSFDPRICIDPLLHLNSFLNERGYQYYSDGTYYDTFDKRIKSLDSEHKLTYLTIIFKKN